KIGSCNVRDFYPKIVQDDNIKNSHYKLNRMNVVCNKCQALKWKDETINFCCLNGKVILASLDPLLLVLEYLLIKMNPNTSMAYVHNIHSYNSVFAFTSLGANVDKTLANFKHGVYTFHIQDALYHLIDLLLSESENSAQFAQLYIYDTDFIDELYL
ncbi:17360_t:CDS:1, partial [Cetraspora pellucida]